MPRLLRPADGVIATPDALYGFAQVREPQLRASARRITAIGVVIDEAYDDVLRRTYTRWPGPMKRGEAFGWLRTVMVNRTQDLCESRATAQRHAPELVEGEAVPDHAVDVAEHGERAFLLRKARGWLTEREWAALGLRAEGATYAEIGAKLGLAESGVDALLSRARARCERKRTLLHLSPVPLLAALRRRLRPVALVPFALVFLGVALAVQVNPWSGGRPVSAPGHAPEAKSAAVAAAAAPPHPRTTIAHTRRGASAVAASVSRRAQPADQRRHGEDVPLGRQGDALLGDRGDVGQRPAGSRREPSGDRLEQEIQRCVERAVAALPALDPDPCRPG